MQKLEIFDPAMCCPTGVCGPSIDPELTRIASALFLLKKKGISIKRYNLSNDPNAFILNDTVYNILNEKGASILPIVLFNNEVVKLGAYPTNKELAEWFQVEVIELETKKASKNLL